MNYQSNPLYCLLWHCNQTVNQLLYLLEQNYPTASSWHCLQQRCLWWKYQMCFPHPTAFFMSNTYLHADKRYKHLSSSCDRLSSDQVQSSYHSTFKSWALVYPFNLNFYIACAYAQSCPTLCNTVDYRPPGSSVLGISQARITGVRCHFLLQGIFPAQGQNPRLLHWQANFDTIILHSDPTQFIHDFLKFLLNIYDMLSVFIGSEDTAVNTTNKNT